MTAVTWNSSTSSGYTVSGANVATKNSGSDSWSDNYIRSNESFDVTTQTHSLTFTRPDFADLTTILGFNKGTLSAYFTNSNDFSIYLNDQKMTIIEQGTQVHNKSGTMDLSDEFKIEISPTSAKYYINGVLEYTSSSTPSGTYYVDAHAYVNGSMTPSDLVSGQEVGTQPDEGILPIEHILFLNTVVPR